MSDDKKQNLYEFRFGIETIDEKLIRRDSSADGNNSSSRVWTAAIVGPDGTGKSILAMHAAIEYLHLNRKPINGRVLFPKVVYVSTDLSFSIAKKTLSHFGLTRPEVRKDVLKMAYDEYKPENEISKKFKDSLDEVEVIKISPSEDKSEESLAQLASPSSRMQMFFVDLQADSAGDDWHFVNQLLGIFLAQGYGDYDTEQANGCIVPNLIVIDAVEGLEAYVGDIDTFGEKRTRRSRIAQLSRICSKAGYNTIFVVERDNDVRREPEQFIADYVFSLGNRSDQDFLSRTFEIEKFRGCWHARGTHELSIRQGKGAYTGKLPNLDEPPIPWSVEKNKDGSEAYSAYLSHIVVTPSLHFENRDFRERRNNLNEPKGKPTFGVHLLDSLLNREFDAQQQKNDDEMTAKEGSITLLLGDAGTHKSRLARKFLMNAIGDEGSGKGVCIYLTTSLLDKASIAAKLREHNPRWSETGLVGEDRLRVRRLSVRHLTSAHLLRIVDFQIRWAKNQFKKNFQNGEDFKEFDEGKAGHVYIVIDDWNHIVETHPNIARDPLFLQSLVANLKRDGVSTLIVSTQPGQPFVETQDLSKFDLRKIDEQHIYAWNTSFFGERRTALTCLNDHGGRAQPTILELRPLGRSTEAVEIVREFALYEGIEYGEAKRVPIEIRLVGPNKGVADHYLTFLQDSFSKVFSPAADHSAVNIQEFAEYDQLAAFADWLDDSRLGKTLILQIDEFWRLSKKSVDQHAELEVGQGLEPVIHTVQEREASKIQNRRSLMDLTEYWNHERVGVVQEDKFATDRAIDFYGVWQALPVPKTGDSLTSYYWQEGNSRPSGVLFRKDMVRQEVKICPVADRVPYLWDFGFLVADRELWAPHAGEELELRTGSNIKVKDVWNALCLDHEWFGDGSSMLKQKNVTWEVFLSCCEHIASFSRSIPLHVDMLTEESLCSLFLEVWGSLSIDFKDNPQNFVGLGDRCPPLNVPEVSIRDLLNGNLPSLKLAAALLMHACPQLAGNSDRSLRRSQSEERFVASRQWYSTASQLMNAKSNSEERLTYLALPGSFTTRGDWFLAVASGSRSQLLAERAIDLLTSRKMNLIRLHAGLGLPVRDILAGDCMKMLGTALPRLAFDTERRGPKTVLFGELEQFGESLSDRTKNRWLWRSRIKDYDRDSFYLRRWIGRILFERDSWFRNCASIPLDKLMGQVGLDLKKLNDVPVVDWKHLEDSIKVVKSALR